MLNSPRNMPQTRTEIVETSPRSNILCCAHQKLPMTTKLRGEGDNLGPVVLEELAPPPWRRSNWRNRQSGRGSAA